MDLIFFEKVGHEMHQRRFRCGLRIGSGMICDQDKIVAVQFIVGEF